MHRHFFGGLWFCMLGLVMMQYGAAGNYGGVFAIGLGCAVVGLIISGIGYFKDKNDR